MDWFSWLSKTNLEPPLVYEYGQAFLRNEFQDDDITYFNNELLQSIGISVARHRLEILKLARKEIIKQGSINRISRLVSAVNKTRKLIANNIDKLSSPIFQFTTAPHRTPYRNHWRSAKQNQQDQKSFMISGRNMTWSGPLDKSVLPQVTNHWGPLDGKINPDWSPMGRPGSICRSPIVSGLVDVLGLSSQLSYYKSGKFVDRDGAQSL